MGCVHPLSYPQRTSNTHICMLTEPPGPTRLITHSVWIKQPLIVVSINYRLNIFGFLATDALSEGLGTANGCNFGLMDQCRAIEWVAANVHAFGGNSKEITIGGSLLEGCQSTFTLCALYIIVWIGCFAPVSCNPQQQDYADLSR